jgi:hypothetical protein
LLRGSWSIATGYLWQKDDFERKALLAVLLNMAFNKIFERPRPLSVTQWRKSQKHEQLEMTGVELLLLS